MDCNHSGLRNLSGKVRSFWLTKGLLLQKSGHLKCKSRGGLFFHSKKKVAEHIQRRTGYFEFLFASITLA
jgi:hypothetical protein